MEKEFVDYYRILGVTFGATEEQLKNAYRNLAKRLHPDTFKGQMSKEREEELTIRFKYVNEAYHILIDKEKRAKYDVEYIIEQERLEELARKRAERQKEQEARRQERIRQEKEEQERRASQQQHMNQEKTKVDEQYFRKNTSTNNDGFFKQVKKSYNEVRADEKRMSFTKRHDMFSQSLIDEMKEKNIDEDIFITMKNGALHVALEFFYQLSKLGRINQDSVVKYMIRNRKTIAAVVIAGTIFSASANNSKNELHVEVESTPSPSVTTVTPSEEAKDENIKLVRYHEVGVGDTLSGLSSESNTTIESIKKANGLTSSTIYVGQEIKIPYYVKNYELQYYTESYNVGDQTLSEIAEYKHTDIQTLLKLNEESIIKTESGAYVILSDSILVPNFITREELYNLKEQKRNS